jgi:hypothetical protein
VFSTFRRHIPVGGGEVNLVAVDCFCLSDSALADLRRSFYYSYRATAVTAELLEFAGPRVKESKPVETAT